MAGPQQGLPSFATHFSVPDIAFCVTDGTCKAVGNFICFNKNATLERVAYGNAERWPGQLAFFY